MKQHRHTNYTLETVDGTIEIPFEIDEDSAKWQTSSDGLVGYLGAIAYDEDCEDPFDTGYEGELVVFDTSKIHSENRPEIGKFKRIIRENPGRVVTVDLFEHSLSEYAVADGPFTVADTKDQDKKNHSMSRAEIALDDAGGYYIVPADVTDPRKYADSVLDSYTDWANGKVYGAWCWRYTRTGVDSPWGLDEESRDSECWGFIGYDYACNERDERIKEAIEADTKEP